MLELTPNTGSRSFHQPELSRVGHKPDDGPMKLVIYGLMLTVFGVAFVGGLTPLAWFAPLMKRESASQKQATDFAKSTEKAMIFALPTVVIEVVVTYGRRGAHLVFEALHGAYDTHMERAQIRLTPIKQRTWCEIARAGARVRRKR